MLDKIKQGFKSLPSIGKLLHPFDPTFHSGVAICIDNKRIRMMELHVSKGKLKIFSMNTLELPLGVVNGEMILSKKTLTENIRLCYEGGKFKSKNMLFSVGGSNVVTKRVDVPKAKELETMRYVKVEAGKVLPFQDDEVMIDYFLHKDDGAQSNQADIVACKSDYISTIEQAIKKAGLKLVCVEPEFYSVFNAHSINITEDKAKENDNKYYNPHVASAFVHVGYNTVSISVMHDASMDSGASISNGMASLDTAISEIETNSTDMSLAELERFRMSKDISVEYMTEFSEFLTDLHSDLAGFCNHYNSSNGDKKIETIYLTGDILSMPDATNRAGNKFMQSVFELEIDAFESVDWKDLDKDEDAARRKFLMNYDLFGLALRGVDYAN